MSVIFSRPKPASCALLLLSLAGAGPALAADLTWKGLDWNFTDGPMAGEADGASSNVSVDADGYLHLRITKSGDTWTASELFTTQRLGFGTYQWHIEGPVDTFDKNNVLGLFPYGPAAGIGTDGTNEIDIEFARWGHADGVNADFANYPSSGTVKGVLGFKFSLGGSTSSTARFVWNSSSIESSVLKGHQALASEAGLLQKWKYAPNDSGVNIPQRAMPLGMNLWCFGAPPSDGKNVEIVIRDFAFVKEGDPLPGGGGTGAGGMSGAAGAANGGAANAGGPSTGGVANHAGSGNAVGGNGGASEPGKGGAGGSPAGASAGGVANGVAGASNLPSAGTAPNNTGSANADEGGADGGCACQAAGASRTGFAGLAVAGLALLGLRRRRAA